MSAGPRPSADVRCLIDDVYSTYLWALDTQDIDLYVGTFWDDAVFEETQLDGTVETWEGAEKIRSFTAGHFGDYNGHQHRASNLLYLPDPEGRPDTWLVRAYWFTSHREQGSGDVAFTSTGHSRDVLQGRDGEWRFAYRGIERWPGTLRHPLRETQA